jgi:hypothetical protein
MKNLLILIALLLSFASCKKEEETWFISYSPLATYYGTVKCDLFSTPHPNFRADVVKKTSNLSKYDGFVVNIINLANNQLIYEHDFTTNQILNGEVIFELSDDSSSQKTLRYAYDYIEFIGVQQ